MTSQTILTTLIDYAEKDDNIRAVLMEGSRAFGTVDEYSDFDIVYVTKSSEPYFDGAILPKLMDFFGDIAVMQTPDNGDPHNVYTHLVQFTNGIRVDLTFNSLDFLSRISLESATAVLLDKDGYFAHTPSPCDSDFWLQRPTEEEFRNHCNAFWWYCPYVAKAIARKQMLHALEIVSECTRKEYAAMLSFLAGSRNQWNKISVGKHATDIKSHLPETDFPYYDALMQSYTGADFHEITDAFYSLMSHYKNLSKEVAHQLEYTIDSAEADKTMEFIHRQYGDKAGQ